MANLNVPPISVGKLIDQLSSYYERVILNHVDLKQVRAVFLWGKPGVGKSESVGQIAERIRKSTKRNVEVRELRLSNCSLIDLIGIPAADAKKEFATWLKPNIFRESENPDDIILMFVDELEKASMAVQQAALQLILERKSFVHELPKNCIFIAAGNIEETEDGVETRLRPELLNRFKHYYVSPDFVSWRSWALENGVNTYVIDYLSYDNSRLYSQQDDLNETAFPTPRSWKCVSDFLNLMLEEGSDMGPFHHDLCADLGVGTALSFEAWYRTNGKLPSVEDIFLGKAKAFPASHDVLYALIESMITFIKERQEFISLSMLEKGCSYVNHFPADFTAFFYKKAEDIPGMRLKLTQVPSFQKWKKKQKRG